MSTTKVTNKSALQFALNAIGDSNPEVSAKIEKMIEQIEKKNASPKKLTAKQVANEDIKAVIVDFLTDNTDKQYTVSALLKEIPFAEGTTNQKVSALLRQLILEGKVAKTTDKRVSYFTLA